jgi:hypothetical protein
MLDLSQRCPKIVEIEQKRTDTSISASIYPDEAKLSLWVCSHLKSLKLNQSLPLKAHPNSGTKANKVTRNKAHPHQMDI